MRIWALGIGFCLALGRATNVAFAQTSDLLQGETAVVSSVLDGETLALRNGREVRLLGIKAPVPPPGWEGPEPWPFAVQAMQALAALLEGATVELRFDARKEDRHGHVLAQVSVDRHGEPAWRGLWRSLTYQVRKAHAPKRLGYPRHTYQHVEGQAHGPVISGPTYSRGMREYQQDMEQVLADEMARLAAADDLQERARAQ